jgi:hypothetical protein
MHGGAVFVDFNGNGCRQGDQARDFFNHELTRIDTNEEGFLNQISDSDHSFLKIRDDS